MDGLPTARQIDEMDGIYIKENEKCPKCGSQLYEYDGGDQGGIPHDFCKKCNYEKY